MRTQMNEGFKKDLEAIVKPLEDSRIILNGIAEDKMKMVGAVLDAIGGDYTVTFQTPYIIIELEPKLSYNRQLFKYNVFNGDFLTEELG